jgi:hypothetical protein
MVRMFDTDGDGRISMTEFANGKQSKFYDMDLDRSGSLTEPEFLAGMKATKAARDEAR